MRVLLILFLIPLISTHGHLPNFTRLEYMRGMKKYVRKLNDWLHLNDLQVARRNKGKIGHNFRINYFNSLTLVGGKTRTQSVRLTG